MSLASLRLLQWEEKQFPLYRDIVHTLEVESFNAFIKFQIPPSNPQLANSCMSQRLNDLNI